jgi:hypothetical protein
MDAAVRSSCLRKAWLYCANACSSEREIKGVRLPLHVCLIKAKTLAEIDFEGYEEHQQKKSQNFFSNV